MGRKQPNQQRYKCRYCKKSWLTDAYNFGLHERDCSGMYPERSPKEQIGNRKEKKHR